MNNDKQLENILEKLDKLEIEQFEIKKIILEIYKNTKRMEDHINFVENTYDNVKIPFHYFMNKVNSFRSNYLINNDSINRYNRTIENKTEQ